MVKRILDANASDFRAMGKGDLLESIRLAEGRTVCAEVVCTTAPLIDGVTNAELAAACGADLITLHVYDVLNPLVMGYRKGKLALKLFEHYEQLGRRYWGRHLWSRGYCVSTVGLDEEKIRRYVKWQAEKDKEDETGPTGQGSLF